MVILKVLWCIQHNPHFMDETLQEDILHLLWVHQGSMTCVIIHNLRKTRMNTV